MFELPARHAGTEMRNKCPGQQCPTPTPTCQGFAIGSRVQGSSQVKHSHIMTPNENTSDEGTAWRPCEERAGAAEGCVHAGTWAELRATQQLPCTATAAAAAAGAAPHHEDFRGEPARVGHAAVVGGVLPQRAVHDLAAAGGRGGDGAACPGLVGRRWGIQVQRRPAAAWYRGTAGSPGTG